MVSVKLFFLCIFYFVFETKCEKVSFIDPCKPDDRACILESAKKAFPHLLAGDKNLGLPPLDTVTLETVNSDLDDLKLTFKKLTLKGINHCTITNIERILPKSEAKVTMECPLHATGEYKASGKIFFLDVHGEGPFHVECEKIKVDARIKIKTIKGSDGQDYWEAARRDVSLKALKPAKLNFENLFDGDEKQAKPVTDVINNSSVDMVESFGKHILAQVVDKIVDIINKTLLKHSTVSELEKS